MRNLAKEAIVATWCLLLLLCSAGQARADIVWRTGPAGQEELCASDVIVTEPSDDYALYRHLNGSVVVTDTCRADKQKDQRLRVVNSSVEERRAIWTRWLKLGHAAQVRDISGKDTAVFNLGLIYSAPSGAVLMCGPMGCPGPQTEITIKRDSGNRELQFEEIARFRVTSGIVTAVLKSGEEVKGEIVVDTAGSSRLIPKLRGLEDIGAAVPADFLLELRQVSEIVFK